MSTSGGTCTLGVKMGVKDLGVFPLDNVEIGALPETNVAPENRPLEKEIPIANLFFSGARLVSGRV